MTDKKQSGCLLTRSVTSRMVLMTLILVTLTLMLQPVATLSIVNFSNSSETTTTKTTLPNREVLVTEAVTNTTETPSPSPTAEMSDTIPELRTETATLETTATSPSASTNASNSTATTIEPSESTTTATTLTTLKETTEMTTEATPPSAITPREDMTSETTTETTTPPTPDMTSETTTETTTPTTIRQGNSTPPPSASTNPFTSTVPITQPPESTTATSLTTLKATTETMTEATTPSAITPRSDMTSELTTETTTPPTPDMTSETTTEITTPTTTRQGNSTPPPSVGRPPCTFTQGDSVLTDAAGVGTCSNNTAQCSKGGGNSDLNVTLGTDGPLAWTAVEGNLTTDTAAVFDICVMEPLYHFSGLYSLTLRVSSAIGVTPVSISVTINDVNQAPEFLTELQSPIYVAEDTKLQSSVAHVRVISFRSDVTEGLPDVIYVWDPDNVTESFGFSNVSVIEWRTRSPNQTTVTHTDPGQSPISLQTSGDPPFYFLVQDTLTSGTNISLTIQATDKAGASDITTVDFVIYDVNQPPVCVSNPHTTTLPLVTSVDASLYTLQCSDSSNLTYTENLIFDYDSFTVSETGEVTLQKPLPLNVTVLSYSVRVTDGGLATNFTIHFNVNRDYPPECKEESGTVTLTQTYQGTQCQNLTLTCDHVPALSSYGLTVNYTFLYNASLFEVQLFENVSTSRENASQSTVQVCPRSDALNRSRQYDLGIQVSSDLGSTLYRSWRIKVQYLNEPPRFNQSSYTFAIPEDKLPRSTVAQVVVGSRESDWSGDIKNGVYVLDPDTDPAFALEAVTETRVWHYGADGTLVPQVQGYFQGIVLGAVYNTFTVNMWLTAGHTYLFLLTAEDYAGAEATTNVTFTVSDVNQPPSCAPTSINVTVNLTTAVGQTIYDVLCSDWDIDPVFSNVTYAMYSADAFVTEEYFSIDPITGQVVLTSQLPTDVTDLYYSISARDGGMLTTNLSFHVTIHRDYEPQCSPPSPVNVTLLETDSSGVCTEPLVTCVDTSGRSLPLTFHVSSDVPQGTIAVIDDNTAEANTTVFKACVQGTSSPSLLPVGQFQIVVNVNNTLRVTSVIINVTIVDVNQPPYFEQSSYYVSVPEDAAQGDSVVAVVRSPAEPQQDGIVNIVKDDPDTVTPAFVIDTLMYAVEAEYVNGTEYDLTNSAPVRLNGTDIVVQEVLRPDVTYYCTLTVRDGEGLSANTTLVLSVTDVNEAPICQGRSGVSLDLLMPVGDQVTRLSPLCRDLDYNLTLRSLRYSAYPDPDAGFFNVSPTGDVTLVNSVPRAAKQLVLNAYAMDGGGLRDNVTVSFDIFRSHPPDCSPDYVPPDGVWEVSKCFRIYPNCSDPTTPPGDDAHLRYSFSGSWGNAFRQSVSPNTTHPYAEFCYLRTTDGVYTLLMNVTNGLANYLWQANINVSYRNAPPKFTVNRYIAEVNETAHEGFPALRVEALVDGQNASLFYSLTGPSVLAQYFSINNSSGIISVASDLSPLATIETVGQVTAQDPQTGLSHSVTLKIKVLDVNQPPTCSPLVLSTNVTWGLKVSDPVVTLNCSDPDRTPGFSSLTYVVKEGADVWRSEQAEVKLISRALLEPHRSLYSLTVAVSDGVFTVTVAVSVGVDRTPPEPVVTVSHVQSNSVNVSWTMDSDYLPVINHFVLTLVHFTSENVSNTQRSYVIRNLTSDQQYSVRVTVDGLEASVTSDDVVFRTPPTAIFQEACTELHLVAEPWTHHLTNNQSRDFLTLQQNLTDAVDMGLRGLHGYVGSKVRSFRAGSVYADVVLITNQSLSGMSALKSAVISLVSSGSISGIPVNSSYSPFYIGGSYVIGPDLTYTSPGKISNAMGVSGYHLLVSGSDVTATCVVRTPGYWHPVFQWRLGGSDVSSLESSGRVVVSGVIRADTDPFHLTSTLTLRRIRESDKGQLECEVRAEQTPASRQVPLKVVARVSATLTPPTDVINPGTNVTLTCTRIAGYDADWSAVFYRVEGNTHREVGRNTVRQGQNSTDHQIPNLTSDVRHQCNVTDRYGWALSNEADFIIFRTDVTEAKPCPEDDIWPKTPAGSTVRRQCPEGYNVTGLQVRTCSAEGQWGNVDTSQCVRLDLQEYQTLIEEGTTVNTTWEVVGKVANGTTGPLLTGDVIAVTAILEDVVNITVDTQYVVQSNELEDFVKSADNVLQAPTEVWMDQTPVALKLVNSVDNMGKAASSTNATISKPVETNKIVLEVGRAEVSVSDIQFPDPQRSDVYPAWVQGADNSVFLSRLAFPDTLTEVRYSAVIYRNLTNIFSTQLHQNLTEQSELSINSPILALSLQLPEDGILEPVQLTFEHITSNFSSPSCQFLNFSAREGGMWSSQGCEVHKSNSTLTVCRCDHLTNFAVLMSPYRPTSTVADVLNIFSIVGCSVSIFCLLLTVIIYRVFWRYVKSDRSVILMNLCVILILAYITFLAGVNRVQYETVCTVVAALLHYLWLVVFFLMLCEGLDIFISVVIIFPTKSVLLKLLLMAYGVPVIIVGVSLGVTRLEGYGGTDFCWLSLSNNLLWAFVGPALAALLANFVFVALVIRALLSTTAMITKANRERAKSVVKAVCVMTPILGLAWIFGVMAVNNDTLVFQVLFVVFNSLQGLMIFVFHCLLSKQIREGFMNKRRQRLASSGAKYSGDSGASKYMYQKRTSDSSLTSNDLGKTTSPFLQVDRQVQRMAAKMSMMDSPNLLTSTDPPKGLALKDPVPGATTPGMAEPFFNIHPNESTTDDVDSPQTESPQLPVDPSFRIESGNLTTFSAATPPSSSPTAMPTTTMTKAVVEKETLGHTSSCEDNEKQTGIPMHVFHLTHALPASTSGHGKGDQHGDLHRQGQTTADKGSNERDLAREGERLQKLSRRQSASEARDAGRTVEDQQTRLDHVYGAGARISRDPNPNPNRLYVKGKGGRVVQSAESVSMTSAPKNPVYSDVMPSLSPTDRWIRAAPAISRHPHHPSSRSPPHPPDPFLQHHPRPTSPRRLSTSADSGSEPSPFPPFSTPRQGEVRYVSSKKPAPPHPPPKPSGWRHEPPVDYW